MHATPTRGVRRFARPGAVALATLGVIAGTTALTWPADATATAKPAAALSTSQVAPTATTNPTLTVINTAPKLTANRSTIAYREPIRLTGMVRYGRTTLVRSRLVWLQSWNGKQWRTIETKKLSADGLVRFTAKPTRSVYYRLAMPTQSKSATVVFKRSTSPRLLVKVAPRIERHAHECHPCGDPSGRGRNSGRDGATGECDRGPGRGGRGAALRQAVSLRRRRAIAI